nr:helix-turn-helix transcriptional regulator [Sulfitobacter sp. R18_1]
MACTLRDMSLSDVAEKSGLGRNAVSQFCSGRSALTYPNMLAVCETLRVPISIIHQEDSITRTNIANWDRLQRMSAKELERVLRIADAAD